MGTAESAVVPSGFVDDLIASGIPSPTAMAFAPDGRLFVAQQDGQLRVISNANPPALFSTPFLTVTVNSAGERGLLGSPSTRTSRPTASSTSITRRPRHRFTIGSAASRRVPPIRTSCSPAARSSCSNLNNLSSATNHNGGALHFGPDGKLYIAVGENANRNNAQTLGNLLGKMLRINADGTIPADNPFFDPGDRQQSSHLGAGPAQSVHLRVSARHRAHVHQRRRRRSRWEEINDGIAGSNYGWPQTEGPTTAPGVRAPLFAYQHWIGRTTGCAITGGAFYNPSTVQFPTPTSVAISSPISAAAGSGHSLPQRIRRRVSRPASRASSTSR